MILTLLREDGSTTHRNLILKKSGRGYVDSHATLTVKLPSSVKLGWH